MAYMTLLKLILFLAAVLGAVRIAYMFRAQAMRRLAAKWGLQYIGPTSAPQWWWNRSHLVTGPPVPAWVSHFGITQIWNVVEGTIDGKSVIIFDSIVGDFRSQARTFMMCQTGQNPFETDSAVDRVVETHGWTVLQGIWFLWFSWIMGTRRLDRHLHKLRFE